MAADLWETGRSKTELQKQSNGRRTVFKSGNLTSTGKKMNTDLSRTPYTKVNSKWVIILSVKCGTIKLLEETIDESLPL